ncbi:hypothetical protein IHC93_19990 [Photobacterium damselae subsp. damselae]|uniref:hypothetical protein n=1 Tax=Photobacterium damselae TaxID=38293 RepID=UPI001F2E933E|nr:hypothetical protein [Photobacterium damselae]UKA27207.1 hypothetical protein IHC93_19990 [Photobacterium damselae subsp. damselae]
MKVRYFALIFAAPFVAAYFAPSDYETKLSTIGGATINADSFMETGDYYFMCQPVDGFLIKKQKPILNLKGKRITTDAKGNERKLLNSILKSDLSNMEYKLTDLRDLWTLSADVYYGVIDQKQLMIMDFKYDKNPELYVSFVNFNSDDELTKSYSELVKLAKSRCAAIGLPR